MRGTAIFLLALALGALAVQGQDSGREDEALQRRIDELAAQLQRRAESAARAGAEGLRLEWRLYEVRDLVASIPDEWMRESNLVPSRYRRPEMGGYYEMEPRNTGEIDWLIEMIRQTVDPESWDVLEGADLQPRNGALFVNTVAPVHGKIAAFLERVREYVGPRYAVELIAVPADAQRRGALAGMGRDVEGAVARTLAAGPRLATWTLTGFDAQQVVVRSGHERRYLADYDVEIAQGAEIGDPVEQQVFDGAQAEVRCMLDRNRNGALVFLRVERTRLDDPIRRVQTQHGPLELPRLAVTRLRAGFWAPLDTPVLLGLAAEGPDGVAILAVVRRVGG